jgi:colanic acid/amylovoran biosynthesis glycosyltransferase
MASTTEPCRVAYLAPEIPALSATFVYEELLALERRGVVVSTFSVHRPSAPAPGQEDLAGRTRVLYGPGLVASGLAGAIGSGARLFKAAGWLLADLASVGPWRAQAFKLVYQWLAGARLARDLRRERCTHLHIHFAHVPAQIGMYAAALAGIPFTVMAHANDIFERGLLLRQKAARAAKMLTISQHNVEHLRSVGVDERRLAIVRCGVSFPPPPQWPAHVERPCYRIGTLGRLVEKKGIDTLLEALAGLRDLPWRWELEVAGDGPLRDALQARARALGIGEQVRFLGSLAHHEVSGWLGGLDAFVLACRPDSHGDMDGIPVVLMEAMSQGVPVVSTRLSGIPELVQHERTGLLCAPADAAALAAEIRRLLETPSLRERLARAARDHVDAEFGQSVNIDRLLGHIDGAAAAGAAPSLSITRSS